MAWTAAARAAACAGCRTADRDRRAACACSCRPAWPPDAPRRARDARTRLKWWEQKPTVRDRSRRPKIWQPRGHRRLPAGSRDARSRDFYYLFIMRQGCGLLSSAGCGCPTGPQASDNSSARSVRKQAMPPGCCVAVRTFPQRASVLACHGGDRGRTGLPALGRPDRGFTPRLLAVCSSLGSPRRRSCSPGPGDHWAPNSRTSIFTQTDVRPAWWASVSLRRAKLHNRVTGFPLAGPQDKYRLVAGGTRYWTATAGGS